VIITRFTDDRDGLDKHVVALSDMASFDLRRDDRILVLGKPDYRVHRNVAIEGEVRFPGRYPIREDKTTVVDLIEMAGGLTDKASLSNSRIVRDTLAVENDPELERLKLVNVEALDPIERAYIKSRTRQEESAVSIDFAKLMNDGVSVDNIVLANGDRVIISRNELTVRVSGAVVSPGHVPYKEGAGYRYYVREAGGFSGRANKNWVRVARKGTRVWRFPRQVSEIGPGDEILVAERLYRDSFFTLRDIIVILSSAATIVLTIVTVQDLLKQ